MNPFFFGVVIGVSLALLNFLASTFISSKIIHRSKLTSVSLVVGGFLARLAVLSLIFFALTRTKGVDFPVALLSFVFCFTLLLILKTLRFYRKLGAISWKQIGR